MIDVIERLADQSGKYRKEAFYYVARAIESSHERIREEEKQRRHISGSELVDEVIALGRDEFGYLAKAVLDYWGIRKTEDIGEIVFMMVDNGILSAQDSDSKQDFANLCDLTAVFEDQYTDFEAE